MDSGEAFIIRIARDGYPDIPVIADSGPISPLATPDQIRAALERAGAEPDWVDPLIAIAHCESRYRLDVVGDHGASLGIFQTWRGWYAEAGEDVEQWQDLDVAARVAVYIRRVRGRFGGAGGWSCSDLLGLW